MPSQPIVLHVVMEAIAGRERELEEQLTALVAPTRKESGCLSYFLHRDPQLPGKFMFYEKFASQEALDLHINSSYFQKFVRLRETRPDPVATVIVTKWQPIAENPLELS